MYLDLFSEESRQSLHFGRFDCISIDAFLAMSGPLEEMSTFFWGSIPTHVQYSRQSPTLNPATRSVTQYTGLKHIECCTPPLETLTIWIPCSISAVPKS